MTTGVLLCSAFFSAAREPAGRPMSRRKPRPSRGGRIAAATSSTLPANELTPVALTERAMELGAEMPHLRVSTLGRREIEDAGMGAFASVARGSDTEPRLIALDYQPPGAREGIVLGLVGKAITFDTGGISLKPAARMEEMKGDMAGGAAVISAVAAVAALAVPLRIVALVPASENMPSGHATRPGDIVTALNGKTIEITNTDAEGRLVLADALVEVRRRGATHVLDLATLTGGVVVALGDFYAGLMGNEDAWVADVQAAADASGDHAWRLPVHDTYRRYIRSPFADLPQLLRPALRAVGLCGAVPAGVRRRRAVGAPGHRGHRVPRTQPRRRVRPEGRDRLRRPSDRRPGRTARLERHRRLAHPFDRIPGFAHQFE